MKRLKYLIELFKEFVEFASANKAWWLVPVVVILLSVAALVFVGQGATPLIYTLF